MVYSRLGSYAFVEMTIFLAILLVGYAYVWVKGDLDWDKPQPNVPVVRRGAPAEKQTLSEEVTV